MNSFLTLPAKSFWPTIGLLLSFNLGVAQAQNAAFFPAGGGGGTPGGSNTQVQFNDSSAFGGDSGFTYAGSGQAALALGAITSNVKALNITGVFNSSGITFDAPLSMNVTATAYAAGSKLVDIGYSGNNAFSVVSRTANNVSSNSWGIQIGGATYLTSLFNGDLLIGSGTATANGQVFFESAVGLRVLSGNAIGWSSSSSDPTTAADTKLTRAAAGVAKFNGQGALTGVTIAALPTGAAGYYAYITDGDSSLVWGATAVNSGSGATKYLVWYNGTNWTVVGK